MESYSLTEIISILREREISVFTLADFDRLFNINNDNTLYKKIQRLEKKKIIKKLIKGKYYFIFNRPNDYLIANFLFNPSYISLESALSFYGIITPFSYEITSITNKKTRKISVDSKEYSYSKIKKELYWGFEKKDNFLIAEPEKAVIDYLYLGIKGWRSIDIEEMNFNEIDKKKLFLYTKRFREKRLLDIIKKII